MNLELAHIATRVFNRPLLVTPQAAEVVAAVILREQPDATVVANIETVRARREAYQFAGTYQRQNRPSAPSPMVGSTAVITIDGKLVNRGAWVGADSGLVSYEGIEFQMRDAMADPEIDSILIDANSPGGEADGIFNLANLIAEANKTKPVATYVNDMAASAMYWLASQAGEIVVSPTSMVGSIGVVVVHLDRSGELAKRGIKATVITAGDHKADFSPFGPLTDEALATLKTEVDNLRQMFAEQVARGRGNKLSKDAALATEARVFTGADAIAAGLADRIGTFSDVISGLQSRASSAGRAHKREGVRMSENTQTGTPQTDAGIPKDQHDAAVSKASADGAAAERTRVAGILGLEEAKGREALAAECVKNGLSIEASKGMLAASPKTNSVAARAASAEGLNTTTGAEEKKRDLMPHVERLNARYKGNSAARLPGQ